MMGGGTEQQKSGGFALLVVIGIAMGVSWGPPAAAAILVLATAVAASGTLLLIMSLVGSERQGDALTSMRKSPSGLAADTESRNIISNDVTQRLNLRMRYILNFKIIHLNYLAKKSNLLPAPASIIPSFYLKKTLT